MDIALISALSTLVIAWLKERTDNQESTDAGAFRDWLLEEAFPQLTRQSEQALVSIVGLKASNEERFGEVLELLREIHLRVAGRSVLQTWESIPQADQEVLSDMYEKALAAEQEPEILRVSTICTHLDQKVVQASCKAVAEQGWATHWPSSGEDHFRISESGLLFVWEVKNDPQFAESAATLERRIAQCAPGSIVRVREIAIDVGLPVELVYAYAKRMAARSEIRIENEEGRGLALLSHVSESLKRRVNEEEKGASSHTPNCLGLKH